MSVFRPGQSVRISDLVSVALVLRVRSIEGNVLELEACDGSFYGFRHASSVAPECTPPAEISVPPLGAGLVAQSSVGGGECAPPSPFGYVSFLRGGKLCRSNVTEREIAELVAVHYRNRGFKRVQVVPA